MGLCGATLSMICGQNKNGLELDTQVLPDFLQHIAHAVSIKQMNHYLQLYSSGKFQQYDYKERNVKIYNSTHPPSYNLSRVEIPIYLYSGGCDLMVAERDVERLKESLANVPKYQVVRNYNHCDFNYGKNSRSLLYEDIVKAINIERSFLERERQ